MNSEEIDPMFRDEDDTSTFFFHLPEEKDLNEMSIKELDVFYVLYNEIVNGGARTPKDNVDAYELRLAADDARCSDCERPRYHYFFDVKSHVYEGFCCACINRP